MTTIVDLGKLRFHYCGDYDAATTYEINDVAAYGGHVYVYTHPVRTAGTLPTTASHWQHLVSGLTFKGEYVATGVKTGESYIYGNGVYVALVDSVGVAPDTDAAKWSLLLSGVRWKGAWSAVVTYYKGDIVSEGGRLYVANKTGTNLARGVSANWTVLLDSISAQGVYNAATAYQIGDLVGYGGGLYRCKAAATGKLPTDATYWELYQDGTRWRGTWAAATEYQPGDLAKVGGSIWRCNAAHTSVGTFAVDQAKWTKHNGGINWRGEWAADTAYALDDVVARAPNTYICKTEHTAGATFDATKWDIIARGAVGVPEVSGQAGKVLSNDGTDPVWVDAVGKPTAVSANTTTVTKGRYLANTSAGAFALKLPAAPAAGDEVTVFDAAQSFNRFPLTIDRNGSNINGIADDRLLNVAGVSVLFIYVNAEIGWSMF